MASAERESRCDERRGWHFEKRRQKNLDALAALGIDIDGETDDGNYWNKIMEKLQSGENGWGEEKRKACHVPEGMNPKDIMKYCNKNGAELVFYKDANDKWHLMTDPRYEGTFNYCRPAQMSEGFFKWMFTGIGHGFVDLAPWLFHGNYRGDPSSFGERWCMMFQ